MKVFCLTVSFLNDLEEHLKWIDIFYGSLKNLENEFDELDHYIILNDLNPDVAKENIIDVAEDYKISGYNCFFKKGANGQAGGDHHGQGLNIGLSSVKRRFGDVDKYDIITVEEFDIFHGERYFEWLRRLSKISYTYESLIGEIGNNIIKKVDVEDYKLRVQSPIVAPHFLAVHPVHFDILEENSIGFRRQFVQDKKGYIESFEGNVVELREDTGSDFFHRIVDNLNFFSLSNLDSLPGFFEHISAISAKMRTLMEGDSDILEIISVFVTKFREVRDKDISSFRENSIFKKYSEKELKEELYNLKDKSYK